MICPACGGSQAAKTWGLGHYSILCACGFNKIIHPGHGDHIIREYIVVGSFEIEDDYCGYAIFRKSTQQRYIKLNFRLDIKIKLAESYWIL